MRNYLLLISLVAQAWPQWGSLGEGHSALDAATGKTIWVLESRAWTPPSLVGTRLYVRDRKNAIAFERGS